MQSAIREAARQGLITVEERRREGQKNLPNVVRVVSREWLTWLKRSGSLREPIGFRKIDPTDKKIDSPRGKRHAHTEKSSSITGYSKAAADPRGWLDGRT